MVFSRTVYALVIGGLLGSSGCTMTKVNGKHPLLEAEGAAAAKVYFIRTSPERRMGFADNPVAIDMNEQNLLTLGVGEYTVLYLVPREYELTLRNTTEAGTRWDTKEMSRRYRFEFVAGATYYLDIRPVDGEFRGIFFAAKTISLADAQDETVNLHPVGLAKKSALHP